MCTRREFRSILLSGVLICLGVLLFHRRVLFDNAAGIPWDLQSYHLPHAVFLAECMRNGEFPAWEPYSYAGRPFAANIQTQTFYPFRLISVWVARNGDALDLLNALEIEEIIHIAAAQRSGWG